MICKDGVIAFATPEQLANMNWELAKCLVAPYSPEEIEAVKDWRYNLERNREWYRRMAKKQGGFEASMLSLDEHVESFEDPSKIKAFSDGCAGAEKTVARCDREKTDPEEGGNYYTQCENTARNALEIVHPETVEVFDLILKNGKNRKDSVTEIAASRNLDRNAAGWVYRRNREKILNFFGVPINQGESGDETADC